MHNINNGIPAVFPEFVGVVVVVDGAAVAVLGVIVVVAVVFLFVVVVVVVKIAVVVVIVFVYDGVNAFIVGVGVQAGIISITPGIIIKLVDSDDKIVDGELHYRNDAYGKQVGLCTDNMAFVIVLETILISMVSSTLSISELTSTAIASMMGIVVISGPFFVIFIFITIITTMGVCLICLAWAAPWVRSPYERVLNMFGMGRPMAVAALWACA